MTRSEAIQAVATLRAAFPTQNIPESTIDLYAAQLEKLPDVRVAVAAVEQVVLNETYWPSLATIRAAYKDAHAAAVRALPAPREPDTTGVPKEVPREVLEFCASAGMPWARKRLQEAA